MIPYPKLLSRIPFEALEPLDDFGVRFSYPQPRAVPPCWAMVLARNPVLDRLEPEQTDREAVATRFEGLRHALYESFEQGKGSALFSTAGIDHPGAWRDVLVEAYCQPKWLYTNAQRTFSLVAIADRHFRVVELPSLESLHEFRTLDARTLPDPHLVLDFGHLDAAETHVRRELATLEMRALTLRDGAQRRTLLLQAAGSRPGPRVRAIDLYVAHLQGRVSLLQVEPERCDAYTVLNRLGDQLGAKRLGSAVVQACATCASFRFSGMIRDASGGTRGFCRRRREAARASGLPMSGPDTWPRFGTVVSVFDSCGSYEGIADEDREVEYCQHGRPGEE